MPGFNKQGPTGAGAMTGRQRGMGRRTEDQSLGGYGSGQGRGMGLCRGMGQGAGQGRRVGAVAGSSQSPEIDRINQLTNLKEQYEAAQNALSILEKKIAALDTGK